MEKDDLSLLLILVMIQTTSSSHLLKRYSQNCYPQKSIYINENVPKLWLFFKNCKMTILDENSYKRYIDKQTVAYISLNNIIITEIDSTFFENLILEKISISNVLVNDELSTDLFTNITSLKVLSINNSLAFINALKNVGFISESMCQFLEKFELISPTVEIHIHENTFESCYRLQRLRLEGKLQRTDFLHHLHNVTHLQIPADLLTNLILSSFEGLSQSLRIVSLFEVGSRRVIGTTFSGLRVLHKLILQCPRPVVILKSFLIFLETTKRKMLLNCPDRNTDNLYSSHPIKITSPPSTSLRKNISYKRDLALSPLKNFEQYELDIMGPDVLIDWEKELITGTPIKPKILNFTASWITRGMHMDVRCSATGDPPVAIFIEFPDGWQKYYGPEHREVNLLVAYQYFTEKTKNYAGDYSCTVVNGNGRDSFTITLNLSSGCWADVGRILFLVEVMIFVMLAKKLFLSLSFCN
ncbi:hypothetical protein HELRODRAFT_173479 [Helobdella robusta]|uniref:Ig-like domain-containing protein n=1 Tax=Helobdella robusta TaxID=6412 RepID=T1F6V4_HELRO|nr:hypothetical protein HELRODRAFT_173479 [Helobdella robusta]ESO03776.1 hypothetical protein HELRODRAFT_173479 [Helobdella robusta]